MKTYLKDLEDRKF